MRVAWAKREQRLLFVEREVALNRFQRKRAIHGAGLQVEEAEAARQMGSERALPRAGRAINGNDRPLARRFAAEDPDTASG